MDLPHFRYHPDPLRSGSVTVSDKKCVCCGNQTGYLYTGPVYSRKELDDSLCPTCISDGSAHKKYRATFHDLEAMSDDIPDAAAKEIAQRTPGFASWQSPAWPACCGDAAEFLGPVGIAEIRRDFREAEMMVLNHIIYEMHISGGAATRLLDGLNKDAGPTAYLWKCPRCLRHHVQIDSL